MLCLGPTPELRRGAGELYAYTDFTLGFSPYINDAAFLFGLIPHIREKEPLPRRNACGEQKQTTLVVSVDCIGFFVKRLFFGVGTVDKQGRFVRMTQALSAV